ncbi:alpha/beta hydrolase [Sediminicoccus sp. KRV36]|uniref:alpha/beta hydrolase n=1 Tax=Sediminicoccus sp. KRV36 TaxID=3133721 RepID=UPI00200ED360|nr:alpha/beta hydrolase [Sediminicoccus rosea]UPY39020.1 alpha/beta hydrolase [Sediminicoccus rosea]
MRRRALVAGSLMPPMIAHAASPGRISFEEPSGAAPGPMDVYLHRPAAWRPGGPVVVVMHGMGRNADGYRDAWLPHAEAHGFLLVCPEYSDAKFPGVRLYNYGNAQAEEAAWTFFALDRAVDAALAAVGAPPAPFALYGHSAGAQFVHRYLLLTGAPRARRIIIANSGWYSWPRFDVNFPHGLAQCAATEAGLRAALGRPVTILLGDQDNDPMHHQLRRDAATDVQGLNRFERGRNFHAAALAAAAGYGIPCGWDLGIVPGVAHSNAGMAQAAAAILAQA